MSSGLEVAVRGFRGTRIVRPIGDLDLASAGRLAAVVDLECSRRAEVVIDLSRLTVLDCAGLRVLLRAQERAEASGCHLRLIRAPDPVQRVVRLTGAEEILPFDSRPHAAA